MAVRVVADLGNSRLKWGRLAPDGSLAATAALPRDDPGAWHATLEAWGLLDVACDWAIASVNPPVADRLTAVLAGSTRASVRLYRSAADVPVAHALETPETTGADRALAVVAALRRRGSGPGQVVSCGTALTVERITAAAVWDGGAIAPGLGPASRALNRRTAQLPLVELGAAAPAAWGRSTEPALAAGLFWGAVGTLRELLARQAEGQSPPPWRLWTGGDAPALARWIEGEAAAIAPDLVLEGLAALAFGA